MSENASQPDQTEKAGEPENGTNISSNRVATASEKEKEKDVAVPEDKAAQLTEEEKEKYANWPFQNVKETHVNDVLYGRGGGTNHHAGNKRYRKMVEDRKVEYVNCKRLDKPMVALSVIKEWRGQFPPGRFLKMNEKTGLWNDVGDKKAREKTSQALREKAPEIREQLQREKQAKDRAALGEMSEDDDNIKATRFAEGTILDEKPVLVKRGHSLGVDYVPDGGVDIVGFSWQEPVRGGEMQLTSSQGSYGTPQMPYGHPSTRMGSHGSYGVPPPPPPPPPPPAPPGSYGPVTSGGYTQWGQYESWSSAGPPHPGTYPYTHTQSGGWARENSLGQNPLQHATVSQAAYPTAFDQSRTASGHWVSPQPPYPPAETPLPYHSSSGPPPGQYTVSSPQEYSAPMAAPSVRPPPSPPYSVDPEVASQWSGQRPISKSMSASSEERDSFNGTPGAARRKMAPVPKPDIVKRATSNQNETQETKPDLDGQSVKRVALNRNGSVASHRLKELYCPGYFDTKKEVDKLSTDLKQSSLGPVSRAREPKPSPLTSEERMTTLDLTALDLEVKPVSLASEGRSTTIEALNLDFDEPFMKVSEGDGFNEREGEVPKPNAVTMESRITTNDLIDIINEPL